MVFHGTGIHSEIIDTGLIQRHRYAKCQNIIIMLDGCYVKCSNDRTIFFMQINIPGKWRDFFVKCQNGHESIRYIAFSGFRHCHGNFWLDRVNQVNRIYNIMKRSVGSIVNDQTNRIGICIQRNRERN